MKAKKQVVVIHGGDFFDTREEFAESLRKEEVSKKDLLFDPSRRWKDNLAEDLGSDYEILMPKMPSKDNARYEEWKVWFEKILPFLEEGVMLIGHSLGGIFLARYLSENVLPVKISALFLVAAPLFRPDAKFGTEANAGFSVGSDLSKISEQADRVYIYQSKDDPIVSFDHAEGYKRLIPKAELVAFENLGHFRQEHFPEIVSAIRSLP